MTPTVFLSLEEILIIHELQIEQYGGSSGLRDFSLLESALYRPQATFGGSDLYDTLFDKASALMHSLIMNHPFVDGNKRTGSASTIVFLELNGYSLRVSQKELVKVALSVHSKKMDLEQIAAWLKKNSKKI